MTNAERERVIKNNMKYLKVSREEAIKIVEDDERIDRGERCEWEPSVEEEKEMRKNSKLKVERRKTVRKPREKVLDDDKVEIITWLFEAVELETENATITNADKAISFVYNGENYTINLIKHRK